MPLPSAFSFSEDYYLSKNLDVAAAIVNRDVTSAEDHFKAFGFRLRTH